MGRPATGNKKTPPSTAHAERASRLRDVFQWLNELGVKDIDILKAVGKSHGASTDWKTRGTIGSDTADKLAIFANTHGLDITGYWIMTGNKAVAEASPKVHKKTGETTLEGTPMEQTINDAVAILAKIDHRLARVVSEAIEEYQAGRMPHPIGRARGVK